jgi:hypothetical protein
VVRDEFGTAGIVPDIVAARKLIGEGYTKIAPNTYRKEFYK